MTLTFERAPALTLGQLPVNEVFQTIQGEGRHTGTPAVFIRLQGCPVGCPWCDTRFTWELETSHEVAAGAMATKDHSGAPSWAALSPEQLVDYVLRHRAHHVVITGGEPAMHDLMPLTGALIAQAGRSVQIETSGTFPIRCHADTWVTVSPKLAMPGGLAVLDEALHRANEIKFPVGRQADIAALHDLIDRGDIQPGTLIYLQPLSLSPKATELCIQNATANNWRVSLQVHALAGWR
jgi:7-carboxy-7-deazaguanine synthase